jgi:ATP-dependent Clp protease ATP-binding subunit ClpX
MTHRTCSFCQISKHTEVEPVITGPFKVQICGNCVMRYAYHFDLTSEDTSQQLKSQSSTPKDIKGYLDLHIIEQDTAKKALSVAIYNHYKRIRSIEEQANAEVPEDVRLTKGNILMVGPTGVGKTAIAEHIAELLDVPFVVKDATTLTSAGYVGEDVESIVRSLWEAADRDVERTQRGIVVIDEVDKIARRGSGGGGGSQGRDVGGEGVQQALLKLIESSQVNIQTDMGRVMRNELVQIDTSNILFIFCGAFVGVEQLIQQRMSPGSIGFGTHKSAGSSKDKDYNELIPHLRTEDLIKFGLIPEFIGRLPVVVPLKSLSEEALKEILWKPKSSLVRQYQRLLMLNNIELEFTEDAMDEIVVDAIKRKAGARGLRSVMERIMLDVMYRAPDTPEGQKRCIINGEVVKGIEEPSIELNEIA